MSSKIICQSCGAENKEMNTFCGTCGARLTQASTSSNITYTTQQLPSTPSSITIVTVPPFKSTKAIIAMILGILSLVLFSWISWLIIGWANSLPLLVLPIVGFILGFIANNEYKKYIQQSPSEQNKSKNSTQAILGIILSLIGFFVQLGGFLFNLIWWIIIYT